jgi:phosphoglycolate phosphatase-like HAD superfamily hydrolase
VGTPKLLALDFDGVISDSAPEAYVIALRSYVALRPDSPLASLLAPLAGEAAPAPAAVCGADVYRAFLALMPLGNRAEDYGVILSALETRERVPDQATYDRLYARFDARWLRAYHLQFYRERHALAERDPCGWRALMRPYTRFVEVLTRRAADTRLAIATAKDRPSVLALLRAYGIEALFDPGDVLDKEAGVSKTAHLELLQRRHGVDFAEIAFLDDKVNHLDSVARLGVRCGLACWGYNGEREATLAHARGHLVCHLDDVEAQLFGAPAQGAAAAGLGSAIEST